MSKLKSLWMQFLQDFSAIFRRELALFRGRPLLWGAVLLIAIIPALYEVIYLSSVWDPYGNLKKIPVALVSLDTGTVYRKKDVHFGRDIVQDLQKDPPFKWQMYPSAELARAAVRKGDVYFAVILPKNLSKHAVEGKTTAEIEVYISEGSSFVASSIGKRFGQQLAQTVNDKLNVERWTGVLGSEDDVSNGFQSLRSNTKKLLDGAQKLAIGSQQLQNGSQKLANGLQTASSGAQQLTTGSQSLGQNVGKLTDGVQQLQAGVQKIQAGLPNQKQLASFQSGAQQLADGNQKLSTGLQQLAQGSQSLAQNSQALSQGLVQLDAGIGKVASGQQQLSSGLTQLNSGSQQLNLGQAKLLKGFEPLQAGLTQLSTGYAQLNAGLSSSGSPLVSSANSLYAGFAPVQAGSEQLQAATAQLTTGSQTLSDASQKLSAAATQLDKGSQSLVIASQKASTGAAQLAAGNQTLSDQLAPAGNAATQLATGANRISRASQDLGNGLNKLGDGLNTLNSTFPSPQNLDALGTGAQTLSSKTAELAQGLNQLQDGANSLNSGAQSLQDGSQKLQNGLQKLYDNIPSHIDGLGGNAQNLSLSVTSKTVVTAAVGNNGRAFTPYFVALSLWVGAVMTTFVFQYLLLSDAFKETSQGARLAAKWVIPSSIVVVQTVAIVITVRYILNIPIANLAGFWLILLVAGFAFMAVIVAMLSLLGDAGRLLAVVILIFQLAASGGTYPIETTPSLFQSVHQYMPVTDMIQALRALLFGSYDGDWMQYVWRLLATGLIALAAAWLLGRSRWKYTPDELYGPGINV